MSFWESFRTALQALWGNKLRSFLTILGIVIGVSAVVFLVSFGRGQQATMSSMFESMGANAIYVTSMSAANQFTGGTGSLTLEDAEALADPNRAPSVELVAPMVEKMVNAVYGVEKISVNLVGVTPEIANVMSYPVEKGVFITQRDLDKRTDVAVLGHITAEDLFGVNNPIGESVRAGGRKFEVIGVVEEKGGMMGGTADMFIMIPLTTMQSRILTQTSARGHPVQTIAVKAVSADQVDAATEQVEAILRQRHHIREGQDNDFIVMDMREILDLMNDSMAIFSVFLGAVGAISLVVGGIGIMNIMLVSVTERTREIGIRKAVGAKRRDIRSQFLVEASLLSIIGGFLGMVFPILGSVFLSGQDLGGMTIFIPISLDIVLIAIGVALIIGIVSGTYPAIRAARLDPIESLRHE